MTAKQINIVEVRRLADEMSEAIKQSKDTSDILVIIEMYKQRFQVFDDIMNNRISKNDDSSFSFIFKDLFPLLLILFTVSVLLNILLLSL